MCVHMFKRHEDTRERKVVEVKVRKGRQPVKVSQGETWRSRKREKEPVREEEYLCSGKGIR